MANCPNQIGLCRDDYKDATTGDVNEYALFDDLGNLQRILLKNGYDLRVVDDGFSVVIEYDYANEEIADFKLKWVGPNEYISSFETNEDELEY